MKKKLYVVDFDNTLVNTAETIRKWGPNYNLADLKPYYKMVNYIRRRQKRGHTVLIISARHPSHRPFLQGIISELFGDDLKIVLVRLHALKWIYVNRWALGYQSVVVVDDMFRKEETGYPKRLFYPAFGMRNVTYITHETVIRLRLDSTYLGEV